MISRGYDNDNYFEQEKKKLIEAASEDFSNKLRELCQLQDELIKLKVKCENTEKVVKIIYNTGKYAGLTNIGNIGLVGDDNTGNIYQQAQQLDKGHEIPFPSRNV